jgi:hypothetical protein
MQGPGRIAASVRATFDVIIAFERQATAIPLEENRAMKLMIEIAAAALLVVCISATSAAFAAGKAGRSADGLSCSFSVGKNASPAARCAAIKRQCGGKFYANYCGDRLLSAM